MIVEHGPLGAVDRSAVDGSGEPAGADPRETWHRHGGATTDRPGGDGRTLDDRPASTIEPDWIETLEAESAARGGDPHLLHEIGRIWEEERNSPRRAAYAYERAHRVDPTHLPTLRSARALFAASGDWVMVARLLFAEENATPCPDAKRRLLRERAAILATRLGRRNDARAVLERALSRDPDHLGLLSDLEQLTSKETDPSLQAEWLLGLAESIAGPPLQSRLLSRAASLFEGRLDNPDRAAALYKRAHELDPDEPIAASEHQRHLETSGAFAEWEQVLLRLTERAIESGRPSAPLLYRLARLQLRLDREEAALSTLLLARDQAPDDRLILSELCRIYHLRKDWEELAVLLWQRVHIAGDDQEKIALLLDLGALYEERLERPEDAIECHRAVVAMAPTHGLALSALGKLLHQVGDWKGLLTTFEAEALATADPGQRAARLFRAAQLVEEKLERPDEAIARYHHILERLPGYLPAREALCRLYERLQRFDDWIRLLEEESVGADRESAITLLVRIAEIQEQRMGDLPGAVVTWSRLVELAPDHLPALRSLGRLAEATGDWERLLLCLEAEAQRASDPRQAVAALQQAAEILDDKVGDRQRAVDAYRRVLALSPAYLPALRALGRIYRQRGQWAELVSMHLQEAEASSDPQVAAAQLFRVGELYEQKLFDEDRAVLAYKEVLGRHPGHLPALRQLSQIYRQRACWDAVVGILLREVEVRIAPEEKAAVLCEIAEIRREKQNLPEGAVEAWAEVLRHVPGHPVALSSLERILLGQGRIEESIAVLERAAAHEPDPGLKAEHLVKAARLQLDFLDAPDPALVLLEEALHLAPRHLFALQLQERVQTAFGSGAKPEANAKLGAHTAAPILASAHSPGENRTELLVTIDGNPTDPLAWDRLERLLLSDGDLAGLCRILERHLEIERDAATRLVLLHRLGRHRLEAFADWEGALESWNEALAIDPGYLPILTARASVLEAMEPSRLLDPHHCAVGQ